MGLIMVLAIDVAAQEAKHDVRVLNGVEVDLTPVARWYASRTGKKTDRPLPHWKAITIERIVKQVSGWDQCVIKNEQGESVELLLANMTPVVRQPMLKLQNIDARGNSLTNQLSTLQSKRSQYSGGDTWMRRQVPAIEQEIRQVQAGLAEIRQERAQLYRDCGAVMHSNVFAMFSGRKYAGQEIWDCGLQKQ